METGTEDVRVETPEEPEDDLRDIIAAQFKEESEEVEVPDKAPPARDESGKFAPKDKAPAQEPAPAPAAEKPQVPPVEAAPPAEGTWDINKAPQSWTPKARERWGAIPEDIRQEIVRREEASVAGVRQLQESFAPVRNFAEQLSGFINEAVNNRVDPGPYIARVMESERGLRQGTDEQRFQALVNIADAYNIPLRKALNELAGQEVLPPPQQLPPEIQRELAEARAFRQQYEQRQRQSAPAYEESPEIKEFKAKSEFFEDVREDMADLLEKGMAKDLADAYDQACWRNPGVRELLLERRDQRSKGTDKRAKAASVSHSSNNSAEVDVVVNKDEDDDDIYESVRKSVNALSNTRV